MKRSLTLRITLVLFLFFIGRARSEAAPGDLDPTFGGFGSGGKIQDLGFAVNAMAIDAQGRLVLVGSDHAGHFHVQRRSGLGFEMAEDVSFLINSGEVASSARAVAFTADGKIVVAGNLLLSDRPKDFAVARLNPDLTLDTTFAGDGTTSSDFNGATDTATGVVVQRDNKIVVGGIGEDGPGGRTNLAIERFNADGNLDRSFGDGNGKRFIDIDADDGAQALAIQTDGKILVAGYAETADDPFFLDGAIRRLNSNGSDDDSFGDSGQVITDFSGHATRLNSMALTADGKIVVAGSDDVGSDSRERVEIARYLSNGAPDTSFAGSGKLLTTPFANVFAAVVQPDHKIVVAGKNLLGVGPDRFIVLRYNEDGSPDTSFGGTGRVFTAFTAATGVNALALQSDGMLIAAGGAQAARYRWDGSLDAGGIVNVTFDPTHVGSEATALAVQPNGQLLAAGKVFTTDYDMGVARFTSDRHGLDVTFGTDTPRSGHTLYRFFHENEEVRAAALAPDGKLVVAGQLETATQGTNMMIGRFNSDGTADNDCALKGFNDVDFGGSDDEAGAVAIAGSKIYLAGTVRGPTNNDYGLVRFANNCTVDSTGGPQLNQFKLRIDLGGDESVAGIVLDANGRPVLAGTSGSAIVLIRVRTSALGVPQMDDAFGDHGRATLQVGTNAVAVGLAQQADGKLVVGGWARIRKGTLGFETRFLVARFTADGQLDPAFGDAGVTLVGIGTTAYALAVRSDDTIAVCGTTASGTDSLFTVTQFTASGHLDTRFNGTGTAMLKLGPDGEDIAETLTFLGPNHLVVGGYSLVFGIRQFALAAFETTPAPASCVGDCNGDGSVTVDELLTMANIALGTTDVSACEAGDTNRDGQITIDEILSAVNVALTSCPTA